MSKPFLHYSRQFIDEKDIEAVTRVLRSDYLTTGPEVDLLQKKIAEAVQAKFCVVVSSGTAALHLAAAALDIGPGSALLTSPVTFVATANAARFCGGGVYLADIHEGAANIDARAVEKALREQSGTRGKIKALFPVHMTGESAEMESISRIAREHGLKVVEDASHALGATYRLKNGEEIPVGSCRFSDMTVFSFHPVKPVTTGEGGAITTNDQALYERLLRLRAHGIERNPDRWVDHAAGFDSNNERNPWYYEMQELGWNFRIPDFACALGTSQMDKLSWMVERRNRIADFYDKKLTTSPVRDLVRPLKRGNAGRSAFHIYVALIDFGKAGVSRAQVMRELHAQGIGTQVNYIPVHHQPYYREYFGKEAQKFPLADSYYEQTLSLPISPSMEEADVDFVLAALAGALKK